MESPFKANILKGKVANEEYTNSHIEYILPNKVRLAYQIVPYLCNRIMMQLLFKQCVNL